MKFTSLAPAALLLLFSTAAVLAQQPTPTPPADDTVKVTTSLVQMDVVVTDKKGVAVTGLQPEDFTIFQDGKQQKITSLTYVDAKTSERTKVTSKVGKPDKSAPPIPPANVRSKQGRLITFVVDDGNCLASADSLSLMRDSMKKFIEEKMQPDDRVAIYRTRGGASLMQMYTSNKEVLRKQLNKITLIVAGFCGSSFEALRDKSTIKYTGQGAASFESEADKKAREDRETNERNNQVVGTIGVLNFVVDRLKPVQQRKIVFLLSDGILADFKSYTYDALRDLADKAARASVVINTVSAKGVSIPGFLSAQDEVLPGIINGPDNTGAASAARIDEERALNEGSAYLAYTTGGRFVRNSNRLDIDITRILDQNSGYYLVGYEPDDETFKGKAFHKIDIKVGRPDLVVNFRKGFYGRTEKETAVVHKTADSPLFQAINSPFDTNGLDIRLTSLLGRDPSAGNYLRAIFHIAGEDITFTDEANGNKKATFDVVAVALDDKGRVAEEFNRTYPITIPARGVATVQKYGLDFSSDISFKKPGVYTVRLAVRDNNSKRLGTAGDVVDVPDVKSDKFYIAGLITAEVSSNGQPRRPAARPAAAAFAPIFSFSAPSIRRFQKGSVLPYVFSVYNARPDKATGKANLTKEIRLYQNGVLLVTVDEKPLDAESQGRLSGFDSFGVLRLSDALTPGEYVFQMIIRDKIANRSSSQAIDFEVID